MHSEIKTTDASVCIDASVVITTRNRRDDVLRAVESCLGQVGCRTEVVVFDDASEDGTSEAIERMFPSVRLFRRKKRAGACANRNAGVEVASGDVIVFIDDDAYFANKNIILSTIMQFKENPKAGAIAIPYIEPFSLRSISTQRKPFSASSGQSLRSFVACAYAVRKSVSLEILGYREHFIFYGEERDFCLRMIDKGWLVIYGRVGFVVHLPSPKRETKSIIFNAARNLLIFDFLNLPFRYLILRLLWDPIAVIRYRFSRKTLRVKLYGVGAGFRDGIALIHERKPVSLATYAYFASLPSHGPEEWNQEIPPPCRQGRVSVSGEHASPSVGNR